MTSDRRDPASAARIPHSDPAAASTRRNGRHLGVCPPAGAVCIAKRLTCEVNMHAQNHPAGMKPLLSEAIETQDRLPRVGTGSSTGFPRSASRVRSTTVLRVTFRRQVSHALKKAFFAFALNRTTVRPEHYFSLGTQPVAQASADGRPPACRGESVNSSSCCWSRRSTPNDLGTISPSRVTRKAPVFHYRPLDADPLLLKRRLMKIATERVDDPTLAHVLRQTQYELDRQITMLADIGTSRFLPAACRSSRM